MPIVSVLEFSSIEEYVPVIYGGYLIPSVPDTASVCPTVPTCHSPGPGLDRPRWKVTGPHNSLFLPRWLWIGPYLCTSARSRWLIDPSFCGCQSMTAVPVVFGSATGPPMLCHPPCLWHLTHACKRLFIWPHPFLDY